MADLGLTATVTRTLLGLADLNINDHVNYYLSPQFLGGTTAWQRNQVTSPFIDGAVTTNRTLQMVTETLGIEVIGSSPTTLQTALAALIIAFNQDSFILNISIGSANYQYRCEASDFQVLWTGPRMIAKQAQVLFQTPRQPVPLAGGV